MTSLAFILGVVPLAIATGAGSASRHSIGTGVIGGMLVATFVGDPSARGTRGRSARAEAWSDKTPPSAATS